MKFEGEVDVEWIRATRDQFYAEAFHRAIEKGETAYEFSEKELLTEMQESRRERNDYEEDVMFWYRNLTEGRRTYGIQLKDVYREVVMRGANEKDIVREMPPRTQYQIANILRGALCLENKDAKREGVVLKRWLPTERTYKKLNIPVPVARKGRPQGELDF